MTQRHIRTRTPSRGQHQQVAARALKDDKARPPPKVPPLSNPPPPASYPGSVQLKADCLPCRNRHPLQRHLPRHGHRPRTSSPSKKGGLGVRAASHKHAPHARIPPPIHDHHKVCQRGVNHEGAIPAGESMPPCAGRISHVVGLLPTATVAAAAAADTALVAAAAATAAASVAAATAATSVAAAAAAVSRGRRRRVPPPLWRPAAQTPPPQSRPRAPPRPRRWLERRRHRRRQRQMQTRRRRRRMQPPHPRAVPPGPQPTQRQPPLAPWRPRPQPPLLPPPSPLPPQLPSRPPAPTPDRGLLSDGPRGRPPNRPQDVAAVARGMPSPTST